VAISLKPPYAGTRRSATRHAPTPVRCPVRSRRISGSFGRSRSLGIFADSDVGMREALAVGAADEDVEVDADAEAAARRCWRLVPKSEDSDSEDEAEEVEVDNDDDDNDDDNDDDDDDDVLLCIVAKSPMRLGWSPGDIK
jgi:enoyl-CoA hydratase/carnithine racemase